VPLTDEERATLRKLQQKEKEPAAPPVGKVIQVSVDLGDEAQVARAIKHGFLTADEVESDRNGDESGEGEGDEAPDRKGYFSR
jgi:hypothetical protein